MIIQHNITAMNAKRNYGRNNKALGKNLEKLSSGYKINRAGDDAAGLAISEKMRLQITGLGAAQKNAADGVSLIKATEGALEEYHDMLNRMYELAAQSANGTYGDTERSKIQMEVTNLTDEIDRIAESTNFNGLRPLAQRNDLATHFAAALANAEAKSGILSVSLCWNTADDLDLHCYTPNANTEADHIYFSNKTADSGELDVDKTQSSTVIEYPVENIFFTKLTNGKYTIAVRDYADRSVGEATEALVRVTYGGTYCDFGFTLDGTGSRETVLTMEYIDGRLEFTEEKGSIFAAARSQHPVRLLVGDTAAEYNFVDVPAFDMRSTALGLGKLNVSTIEDAASAMNRILNAIDMVSSVRSTYGAIQNRLEHTMNNLATMQENVQSAESVIRDTDVAEEMMEYTKNSILLQSAQSMMAQANQLPQGVISLLQG